MSLAAHLEHFHYFGLFLLLILGGVGLPFPEDATLILCGFLIGSGAVKPVPALAVVYVGLLTADLTLHFLGRKYGREIVVHPRFQKFISPERLADLEDKFNRKGVLFILLGRHLIGLRAQIFLVSGVLKMPLVKFLLADGVAALFSIALMTGAGYLGGNSLTNLQSDITRLEQAFILFVIALLAGYVFYRHFRSRSTSKK
jgi:membrane protein DedA with SNARE-associated domain